MPRGECTVKVVSFDLDGTLVHRDYVDYFWLELVPRLYAEERGMSVEEAKRVVLASYEEVGPRDIRWYLPSYWFHRFGISEHLDYALREAARRVRLCEDAAEVIEALRGSYELVISTSAPRVFIEVVMSRVPLLRESFTRVFSSTSDYGLPGKPVEFFANVIRELGVEPCEVLHAGDDEEFDYENPSKLGIKAYLVDRERGRDLRGLLSLLQH